MKQVSLLGYVATIINGQVIISLPNEDVASSIVMHLSNHLLDKHLHSLRLQLPTKTILVRAKDSSHLSFRAEDNQLN